jgi:hypothetical protein
MRAESHRRHLDVGVFGTEGMGSPEEVSSRFMRQALKMYGVFMAKRMQFCTALFLSASVFVTGCTVDVQDPNTTESDPSQSGTHTTTNTAPVIQLVGEPLITIPVNSAFADPGVVATDVEDGDLTNAVYSNSIQVDTSRPGQYEITYRVNDSGNLSSQPVKRTVIVSAPEEVPANQPAETLVPAVKAVKLVGFTATREMVELSEIENGSVIDLSETSIDLLNIVADSADVSKTGSVHFRLTGPISVDRWENNAIYTMVVDTVNLSVSNSQLPVGDYTLVITPYSSPDMAGNKGAAKTVTFKVVDKKLISNVPKIAAVNLVSVTEDTGDYVTITRISEGAEINLALIDTKLVNVIAISEDAGKTGSVHFSLSGPVDIDRAENSAAYALANETQHLDLSKNALPAGDYTLVVTPYAGADAKGEAGIPLLVNFSVVGEVVVAPPAVPAPVAVADSYTFQLGSDAQPGQVKAVSANDQFEDGAVYAITKAPANGSARMFDMGFFTYSPNSGFSGTDTFTYQITQAGKISSATVSLNVVAAEAPTAATSNGFTAIKPSADSKLIYVSSSSGKDTNTCLSENAPCKTVAAGLEKMRNGYPDHLYLKRGDVWRNERLINLHSGRSAKEPAVISYYGTTGPRPRLENDSPSLHIFKGAMKNFSFIGLEFHAYKMDPKHADFTGEGSANITLLGGNENIHFEDNKFNLVEMIVQKWETGTPSNITLRRNIWTGAYQNKSSFSRDKRPSNLYVDGATGLLIEENVFDHGGWNAVVDGAGANMFNHNIYIQGSTDGSTLILRNNIITRASSHGAQLRPGGLAEDNFFGRNTVGLLIGYAVEPLKSGVRAHAIDNVISEGVPMYKGKGACSGANLCTSAMWGLHFDINGAADYRASNNVVSTAGPDDSLWKSLFSSLNRAALPGVSNAAVKASGNIAWRWDGSSLADSSVSYPAPGRTLGDYNQSLGGERSFEAFMDVVLARPVGTWDKKYTANAINTYIRAGFGK